jgi:hypothetical protein
MSAAIKGIRTFVSQSSADITLALLSKGWQPEDTVEIPLEEDKKSFYLNKQITVEPVVSALISIACLNLLDRNLGLL